MKRSTHCNFFLPEENDYYNINDSNNNFIKIDSLLESIAGAILNTDAISDAFSEVYPSVPTPEIDPIALDTDDVADALSTPWDGTSSTDPTALSSANVSDTLATPWDGTSSTDEDALQSSQIADICK